ncbi:MAG: hypothetical protein KatS3mg009_0977 [Acidimicrobiia bacterium]|nr:MAG: hypothetical protein KatS3mg009_0977 [Acidimicrobiia bacterium]
MPRAAKPPPATRTPVRRAGGRRPALVLALVIAAVASLAACGDDHGASAGRFTPRHPDRLVVATANLPAPGFWDGPPAAPTGGFEHGLAHALARRFGLRRVEVVEVPFASLLDGDLRGADLALSQLTPTGTREERLDFSTPYLEAPPAVLGRPGTTARDLQGLRRLRFVVVERTTLAGVVERRIRPLDPPLVVARRRAALDAITGGRADAMVLDLPVALGLAADAPGRYAVAARLRGGEGLAVALPDGSPGLAAVDSAVRALLADGTIDDLARDAFARAGDPDAIPLVRTRP